MSLSKKHYIKIARALHQHSEELRRMGKLEAITTFHTGVAILIQVFEEDNPRFDRERFMDVVNVGEGA